MTENSIQEIIDPEEIISYIYEVEDDPAKAWNMIQLRASFLLIRHFFGEEWYDQTIIKHGQGLQTESLNVQVPDLENNHPLKAVFFSGEPADMITVLRLGVSLKILGFDNPAVGLSRKIRTLRDDRYENAFQKASFELKAAATFASYGFHVEFVEERPRHKTPDLLVLDDDGHSSYVECKKRNPVSDHSLKSRSGGVMDRAIDANEQFKEVRGIGISWLEVEDNLSHEHPDLIEYINTINELFGADQLSNTQCVQLSWEIIEERGGVTYLNTGASGIPNSRSFGSVNRAIWCNPDVVSHAFPYAIIDMPGGPLL